MNEKAVDSLISVLSNLWSRCQYLELKVSVAESLLQEHASKLREEYDRTLSNPQLRGFSVSPSPALQELRKDMLRGSDEEAPS